MASPYWFYLSDNEEIGDLPVQDHQHTQRRDILDAETEEIIDPRAVLAVEEDLLPQGIRLHSQLIIRHMSSAPKGISRPSATLSNRPSQLVLQPGSLAPARPSSSAGEM